MSKIDDRIMAYLRTSIAARGGNARRLSRIQMEMPGPYVEDREFSAAINRLKATGRIELDEDVFPGFVYVRPR